MEIFIYIRSGLQQCSHHLYVTASRGAHQRGESGSARVGSLSVITIGILAVPIDVDTVSNCTSHRVQLSVTGSNNEGIEFGFLGSLPRCAAGPLQNSRQEARVGTKSVVATPIPLSLPDRLPVSTSAVPLLGPANAIVPVSTHGRAQPGVPVV